MDLKRVISLPHSEAMKIYARINNGTMKEYFDDEEYLCYDKEELKNWKSKKVGRKPRKRSL